MSPSRYEAFLDANANVVDNLHPQKPPKQILELTGFEIKKK